MGAHTAGAYALRLRRRLGRVDAAEQLAVAPDVADRVDAGSAVLAAPVHLLRGEGKLAAVVESAAGLGVRCGQRERVRRIDGGDRRLDLPRVGKIDQAGALDRADESCRPARARTGSRAACTECRQGGGDGYADEAARGPVVQRLWHISAFHEPRHCSPRFTRREGKFVSPRSAAAQPGASSAGLSNLNSTGDFSKGARVAFARQNPQAIQR